VNRQGFLGCLNFVLVHRVSVYFEDLSILGRAGVLAYAVSSAIPAADQWSKAVALRLGKFPSLYGPRTDLSGIL
jgi:hypothetical protein